MSNFSQQHPDLGRKKVSSSQKSEKIYYYLKSKLTFKCTFVRRFCYTATSFIFGVLY